MLVHILLVTEPVILLQYVPVEFTEISKTPVVRKKIKTWELDAVRFFGI